jgi:hypothetical protein
MAPGVVDHPGLRQQAIQVSQSSPAAGTWPRAKVVTSPQNLQNASMSVR